MKLYFLFGELDGFLGGFEGDGSWLYVEGDGVFRDE